MGCTASTTDNKLSAQNNNSTINANISHKDYNNRNNSSNYQNSDDKDINDLEERVSEREAAIKIQSNFRGYKTRKELKTKENSDKKMKEEEEGPVSVTPLFYYSEVLHEMKTNALFIGQSGTNVTDENKAATTIQAGFKGYKVRKEYKKQKSESNSEDGSPPKEGDRKDSVSDEIADIDLNDPEVEKAATKIQATFRGYKKRRETTQ